MALADRARDLVDQLARTEARDRAEALVLEALRAERVEALEAAAALVAPTQRQRNTRPRAVVDALDSAATTLRAGANVTRQGRNWPLPLPAPPSSRRGG